MLQKMKVILFMAEDARAIRSLNPNSDPFGGER